MRFEIFSPEEIDRLHSATIQLLTRVGVRFASQPALERFAAAGCTVDFGDQRVRISENVLEGALKSASNHFRLWHRNGNQPINLRDGQVRGHNVGSCVRVFDLGTGQARPAKRSDLERMTVLIDALEHIHVCRPVVYPAEFPSAMWDIYTAATMLRFTDKPYGVSAYSLDNLSYILQLTGAIAGGLQELKARPFIWGSICPDSPLSYSQSTADILMRYAELGLPVAIAPCPVCGGTSPITLAGTLAQLNAEFLAGFVLVQLIRPGIDVKYTARPLPMNMRTGNAAFGGIELGMMSAAIVQLARRYQVCSDVYGLGTRSRYLDEQAAYEKALNGLLVGMAGADLVAAAGLLDDALTSSPEQLVIDNEILGMIFRSVRGISLTDETLALAQIMKAGPGGNFLADPHTRAFLRKEFFLPKLVYRTSADLENPTVLEVAHEQVKALLDAHQPALLPEDKIKEVGRILDLATRSLG